MGNLANVKLTKKAMLDELQAKLVLLHQKLTQQDILDKCIEFSSVHFDSFVQEQVIPPQLTEEKLRRIQQAIFTGEIRYPTLDNDDVLYREEFL